MFKNPSDRPTFLIQIVDRQHDTWQGELTWVNSGQKIPFRSMLELARLIDSAVSSSETPTYPPQET